ncbi:MAG: hypothetical protein WEE64_07700 [Dehalococcoidia bacterium]
MQQPQTSVRQPDETICFSCNATIKRDVGLCPRCGTRIAEGPAHTSTDLSQLVPRTSSAAEDTIGAGRYILNFLLAGLIGLGLSYFLRRQGWLATWISIPICILSNIYTYYYLTSHL